MIFKKSKNRKNYILLDSNTNSEKEMSKIIIKN